jgi:hypothetical protein
MHPANVQFSPQAVPNAALIEAGLKAEKEKTRTGKKRI